MNTYAHTRTHLHSHYEPGRCHSGLDLARAVLVLPSSRCFRLLLVLSPSFFTFAFTFIAINFTPVISLILTLTFTCNFTPILGCPHPCPHLALIQSGAPQCLCLPLQSSRPSLSGILNALSRHVSNCLQSVIAPRLLTDQSDRGMCPPSLTWPTCSMMRDTSIRTCRRGTYQPWPT